MAVFYELSSTDQGVPRIYTRKVYTFGFPSDEKSREEAIEQVHAALTTLSKRWSFITGQVGPLPGGLWGQIASTNKNLVHLYQLDRSPHLVRDFSVDGIFRLQRVSDPGLASYTELCEAGMPPSRLLNDLLYAAPHIPVPGTMSPAFYLRINYVPGGMMLSFNFHHCMFDGTSCVKLIREFARTMRGDPKDIDGVSLLEVNINRARLAFGDIFTSSAAPPSLSSFPEFVVDESKFAQRKPPTNITKCVITFSSATVEKLKELVNILYAKETGTLSKQACLAALIWIVVMRARSKDLNPAFTSKLGIAVDFRPRMKNVIPKHFMGNAIVHTVAKLKVLTLNVNNFQCFDEFVNNTDDTSETLNALLNGALQIRDAVDLIKENAIRERLNLFATIQDPTVLPTKYAESLDLPGYGLDFSSWKDQCADLDFGIKHAKTAMPDYVRMTWGASEGALNILPRKGGSDGGENWEVLLGLRETDWVGVKRDLMDGRWANRIVV